ncbi:response regulator [bacterium]|nr:response regulator [candidate division CSSED10-310 bacterium]
MNNSVKPLNLLLIEDNENDIALVQRLLQTSKLEIKMDSCTKLKDGITQILSTPYDLLLLDLSLPDGHGLDGLVQLKSRGVHIPIVILTSTNDRVVASIAIRQGAQDYIVKENITAASLLRSIHYAIERKAVENALETERSNFHSIVEMVNEGIIIVNLEGQVKFMNRAAEQFLKTDRNQLVDRIFPFILEKNIDSEIPIRRMDGDSGKGLCHTLYTDWQGKDAKLVMIHDITDERAAEQMKDTFLQNVSHELRTPLTAIKESIAQVIEGLHGKINIRQIQTLSLCLKNVDYLKRTVDNLLDISKLESGRIDLKKAPFDFAELLGSVVQSLKNTADSKNIKLDVSLPPTPFIITADRDKITHVLMNLIGNALKFTHEGSVHIRVVKNDADLEFCISDTGIGISKQELPKIFEKFVQFGKLASVHEKGTGLGLSITKALIELHGGKIWAESIIERGSQFFFTLPLSE